MRVAYISRVKQHFIQHYKQRWKHNVTMRLISTAVVEKLLYLVWYYV